MRLNIKQIACHRNGISGEPFHVVTFSATVDKRRNFVATVFSLDDEGFEGAITRNGRVAVFDADMLATGNITFGENSWRGDDFEDDLRRAIAAWEAKQYPIPTGVYT